VEVQFFDLLPAPVAGRKQSHLPNLFDLLGFDIVTEAAEPYGNHGYSHAINDSSRIGLTPKEDISVEDRDEKAALPAI
jgi:hypothetical protein